ncbi:Arm DNA-binding domain-containing protein, partial [Aeromonas hydrophila]
MSKDKLTDSKLRTAKPEAKEYSLGDGDGLYLRVKPNGARLWVVDQRAKMTRFPGFSASNFDHPGVCA